MAAASPGRTCIWVALRRRRARGAAAPRFGLMTRESRRGGRTSNGSTAWTGRHHFRLTREGEATPALLRRSILVHLESHVSGRRATAYRRKRQWASRSSWRFTSRASTETCGAPGAFTGLTPPGGVRAVYDGRDDRAR